MSTVGSIFQSQNRQIDCTYRKGNFLSTKGTKTFFFSWEIGPSSVMKFVFWRSEYGSRQGEYSFLWSWWQRLTNGRRRGWFIERAAAASRNRILGYSAERERLSAVCNRITEINCALALSTHAELMFELGYKIPSTRAHCMVLLHAAGLATRLTDVLRWHCRELL